MGVGVGLIFLFPYFHAVPTFDGGRGAWGWGGGGEEGERVDSDRDPAL